MIETSEALFLLIKWLYWSLSGNTAIFGNFISRAFIIKFLFHFLLLNRLCMVHIYFEVSNTTLINIRNACLAESGEALGKKTTIWNINWEKKRKRAKKAEASACIPPDWSHDGMPLTTCRRFHTLVCYVVKGAPFFSDGKLTAGHVYNIRSFEHALHIKYC